MQTREEQKRENTYEALIKILQADVDTEEEAARLIQEDVSLYQFASDISNLYKELEEIRNNMMQGGKSALDDYLKSQDHCCCCCCCHKGKNQC